MHADSEAAGRQKDVGYFTVHPSVHTARRGTKAIRNIVMIIIIVSSMTAEQTPGWTAPLAVGLVGYELHHCTFPCDLWRPEVSWLLGSLLISFIAQKKVEMSI